MKIEWPYLAQDVAAEAALLVGLEDAQPDEADHGRLFDAGVRLLGAVADESGQQRRLFGQRLLLLQSSDCLSPRRQHRHEDALAGRSLEIIRVLFNNN